VPRDPALEALHNQALEIARGWSVPDAPASWELTARIFSLLADDDDLLALAVQVPPDRLPALLFCAAARHLVTELAPPELARYFPTGGDSQPTLDAGFDPAFRSFCLHHRSEILTLCRRHRYQMNEVARSTQVALAVGLVSSRHPGSKIALIDIGTGSGLGLHIDRYGYRLSDGRHFGDHASPLQLLTVIEGALEPPIPFTLPPISMRIGIDVDPIDLADPDARRWVRSCVPPEAESLSRFDRAVAIAVAHRQTLRRGDAIELLPDLLAQVPSDHLTIAVDAFTAVFFSDEQRARFRDILADHSRARDLDWISLDPLIPVGTAGRYSVQELPVDEELVQQYQQGGVFGLLSVLSFRRGRQSGRLLARAHPSGTRMTWLDPETAVR
jgi:hypothetical protein